ncbi:hypothetical protein HELRODRAFT_79991, partial [Helobdella robusta]|uniref:Peptidase metallopeptidase domain-containing protein n=1 Tax=Helobdella robusta TaxID=6412 RepID=T1G3W1_HELRO
NYLKSFGYLKEGLENDEVSLEDAVKTLQRFAGLKQTGALDDATLELMKVSRCSLPDMEAGDQKSKRFETVSEEKATIKISFEAGNHSDKYRFDGKGGVLGHGFFPTTGVVHFDDDELWSNNRKEGKQLAWVAIHEFGHALGLNHSNVTSSVMFPYYKGYKENIELQQDDIDGITSLYPN